MWDVDHGLEQSKTLSFRKPCDAPSASQNDPLCFVECFLFPPFSFAPVSCGYFIRRLLKGNA